MSIKHRHSNIRALFLIVLCFTISGTHAFYPNRFKKCDQSGFCRRNRDRKDLQPITVKNIDFNGKSDSSFTSELTENDVTTRTLQSKLTFYEDGIVNIKVTETSRTDDLAPRFDAAELVMQDSKVVLRNEKVTSETAESYKFSLGGSEGAHLGSIEFPKDGKNFGFRVVDENGEELIVADSLLFENHMKKPEAPPKKEEQQPPRDPIPPPRRHRHNPDNPDAPEDLDLPPPPPPHEGEEEIIPEGEEQVPEEVPEQVPEQAQDNVVVEEVKKEEEEKKEEEKPVKEIDGGWEEHFDGGHDSKPNGPGAVGLDIKFPQSNALYGIPEHASSHILHNTRGQGEGSYTDPYRLYNVDVFEYETNQPVALYGSVPLLYAHSTTTGRTVGIFWLNPTETWVDLSGLPNSQGNGNSNSNTQHTRWTSEDGNVDVWVLPGPTVADVSRQYTSITGRPYLPPLYSQMHHQSRWNYVSSKDVCDISSQFNAIDMPADAIWLDIEHTKGKRYFTWDLANFPEPEKMQEILAHDGRHLVTIIDCHIKRDSGYHVNSEAQQRDFFVKNSGGNDAYQGDCWPGSSSWIDFLNPAAREWWAGLYSLDSYRGSTNRLGIWNDMNEPAIFKGPEETMSKDAKHFNNVEHRSIHNMYGYLNVMATFDGLSKRSPNERPFVLTRAFFAGSQKYAAVWTGDNAAKWEHLQASIPMALSLNLAGIVHSGADVGGFFGNPDDELLVRWYQTAAFLPFFRAHAHIETRRREPWLFGNETRDLLKMAVIKRYALLPYWSTAFYNSHVKGSTVIKGLWEEFPKDSNAIGIDNEFLVGHGILVHPVTSDRTTSTKVYFPQGIWYDADTLKIVSNDITKSNEINVEAPLNKIPVFYRGGYIIPRKERLRRSSEMMAYDPFTLVIALDEKGSATGELFVDDGVSFDFEKEGKYFYAELTYEGGVLQPRNVVRGYDLGWSVERIVVLGLKKAPNKVVASVGGSVKGALDFVFDKELGVLTIKKPVARIAEDWKVIIS